MTGRLAETESRRLVASVESSGCMSSQPETAPQEKGKAAGRSKPRRWIVLCGAGVVAASIALWQPLQTRSLVFFLLHSESPSEQSFQDAAERVRDLPTYLTQLWETGRFPQRLFAMGFLNRNAVAKPDVFRAMAPVVLQAANDVDLEVRRLAFECLKVVKHPDLRTLALQQLSDKDPGARLMGVQVLRGLATTNDVAIAMQLLSDPEPRVVVAAAQLLHTVIGKDFELKSSMAQPQFTFIATSPPPAPDLPSISRGVERWQAWWREHQAEYPVDSGKAAPNCCSPRLAMRDFQLKDAAGHSIQISSYKGKIVLLAFWSPDMPESLDVTTLKALQSQDWDCLDVISICIPPAPSCADEHELGHTDCHEHAHYQANDAASSPEQMRAVVEAKVRSANFPVLSDPPGALGLRFSVEDRPTYVLVDSAGAIRRRFGGIRSESALQAMVDELRARSSSMASQRQDPRQ